MLRYWFTIVSCVLDILDNLWITKKILLPQRSKKIYFEKNNYQQQQIRPS